MPGLSGPRVLVDATAVPADRGGVGRYVDGLIAALAAGGADLAIVCQRADAERYGRHGRHADRRARSGRHRPPPGPARVGADRPAAGRLSRSTRRSSTRRTTRCRCARAAPSSSPSTTPRSSPSPTCTARSRARSSARRPARRCVAPRASSRRARPPATSSSGCSTPTPPRSTSPTTASTRRPSTCRPRPRSSASRPGSASAGQSYVAFLGMLEPRKNVPGLIRGWVKACEGRELTPALVLAGGSGWDDTIDATVAEVPVAPARAASGLPALHRPAGLPRRRDAGRLPEPRRGLRPAGARGDGLRRARPDDRPALAARGRRRRRGLHRARPRRDRARTSRRCSTTPTGGPAWARPVTSARSSSPGRPAPRRTWRRSPALSSRDRGPCTADRPRRRRHLPPGRVARAAFLSSLRTATTAPYEVVLADNGSTDGAPAAAVGTRGAAARDRRQPRLRQGRQPRRRRAPTADWLVVANPDVDLGARRARRAARRGRALAARGLPRAGDPHARRPALPLGAGVPVARPRHRARRVRLVVAGATRGPAPTAPRPARRSRGRPAGCPGPACCCAARPSRRWRLRPDLLHVLRGHGPVPAARRGRLVRTSTCPSAVITHAGRPRDVPRRPGRCCASTTGRSTATCPGSTPDPRWAPVRLLLGAGLLLRYLLAARVRSVGEGAAPTRSADLLEDRT